MGDLDADIKEFEEYSKIAEGNGITDVRWAKASHLPQPRLAELRRIARLMAQGLTQQQATLEVKRGCTVAKLFKLYQGLCRLLGGDYMAKQLERLVKETKDPQQKIALLAKRLPKGSYEHVLKTMWNAIREAEAGKKGK